MSRHSALFACLVSWVLAETAGRQAESLGAQSPFNLWEDSPRDESTTRSGSNRAEGGGDHSTYTHRRGSGGFNGKQGADGVRGYGSVCSLENQCNVLLGLACVSHEESGSRCACAPATPVYVNEAGVQKCVQPKELHEACVSDQECSYNNPNVQCVNFLCNCSSPFELTPERDCRLPSGPAASILPTAISVMLALALLIVVGGYVYQKMLRERERSSSLSAKAGRSVHADTLSTSSTTPIPVRGQPWEGKGECDQWECYGESWRPRSQSEHSLPLHPPRYISHRSTNRKETGLSTVPECCSVAERTSPPASHSASSLSSGERSRTSVDTALHRTLKEQDLVGQDKGENRPLLERNDHSSSSPMHMLLPEDEQMRRILNNDQQVVITVQARRGRHSLRTGPSLPPVVSLRRHEPPPSESTDDSFMKDLKRRRRGFFMGRRSEELSSAAAFTSMRRSASASAAPAAARNDALLRLPAPMAVGGVQRVTQPTRKTSGTTAAVHGCSAATQPTKRRATTVEPMRNQREPPEQKEIADDRMLNTDQKTDASAQAIVPPVICDGRTSKHGGEHMSSEGPCDTTRRTSLNPATASAASDAEAKATRPHSVSEAQVRYVKQSEHSVNETSAQQGTACVERVQDIPRACLIRGAEESQKAHHSRPQSDEKDDASLTGVTESQEACRQADSTPQIRTPAGLKQRRLNISEEIPKDTMADHQPTPVCLPEVSLLQEYGCRGLNAKPTDLMQAELIIIEEIGEMANLLSALIGKHVENTRGSTETDAQPSPTTEHTCPGDNQEIPAPVRVNLHLDRAEEPISVPAIAIKPGLKAPEFPTGAKFHASFTDEREEQVTKGHPCKKTGASNTNAADRRAEPKPSARPNVRHKTCRSITVREAVWPSWVEIIDTTFSEMRQPQNFSAVDHTSPLCGLNRKTVDHAKRSSNDTSGKIPEPITLHPPQGSSGLVWLGASHAAETNGTPATREILAKETDETTVSSPTFSAADHLRSFLRKHASASSVASETTPSMSLQNAYREYMAKNLESPVYFTERPFVDVLASLESEMASIAKDEQKADTKHDKAPIDATTKPPDTGTLQSSSHCDMNGEDLNEAAIELFYSEDAESDSRAGIGSDEAVETCTSASSAKVANIGCLATQHHAPTRTKDGEEASETPRVRTVHDDPIEGPIALPETKLPTVVSSSHNVSQALTSDRAEPQGSEETSATRVHGSSDSVAILMPPQAASSPAVQADDFRQSASFESDRVVQIQSPPPYAGTPHPPQLGNDHQHNAGRNVATELQCTADVGEVLTLGNECCLMQHLPQQAAPESATRLDETQYVLFHMKDPGQPTVSRTVESGSVTHLRGCLETGCHESVRDATARCHAAPSRRHESEGSSCEPPTLSDKIVEQCPVVGSKDLITAQLSKASSVPPLHALCSQVLPSDEKREEEPRHGGLTEHEGTLFSHASFENAAVTAAVPCETACRQKGSSGALSTPVAGEEPSTSSGVAEVQLRRRGRSQSVGATGMPLSRPDQGRGVSDRAMAAGARSAKKPIRFLGPLSTQNVVVLPDSSVAICLPEGASRDDLWAPLSGSFLRHNNAAGGPGLRHRHLLLASALEDPSFESIYNAILVPHLAAQEASSVPGDVPCRPTRSTSSSRAVSFDNSPTVVPLEPPPEPFAQCDVSQTTDDTQTPLPPPFYRARRRSSLCRSSSGSLLQEIPADLCPTSGARRAFCRMPSILLEPDGACSARGLANGATSDTQSGGAPPIPEARSALLSSFYSFEDIVSEHSSLPDTVHFDSSRRCPALQKCEGERRDRPANKRAR